MKLFKTKLPPSKYIRIYSDIHLDFDVDKEYNNFKFSNLWFPEDLETDKETILILAGDLWHAKKPYSYQNESWLKVLSEKFQYVLIVLGNHDFWGGNLPKEYSNYRKSISSQNIDNTFLIQDNMLEIGNNKFIGGTLWTDYLSSNSEIMNFAEKSSMNDYKYISYGLIDQRIRSKHLLSAHLKTRNFIFVNSVRDYAQQKIWVITHHAPSIKSIPTDTHNSMYENALYYSNLDSEIKKANIDYWIHGHIHEVQNYFIGKTQVISNPRGYPDQDTQYTPWHLLEL